MWLRSERSRNYWLWTILGYKSILTGRGDAPRRPVGRKGQRPSGNPLELRDGRRGDGGPARRRAPVHRLARRPLGQGDQVLRHLLRAGRRRLEQGLERQLLGRSGRARSEERR